MSDNKIVGIDGKPVEPEAGKNWANEQVIDLLEKMLADARAKKIDSIAVAYTTPEPDGMHLFQSSWAGPRITLLGSLTRCIYALNAELNGYDRGNVNFPER